MSEEKEPGFFGQIKNQIVATVGIVITAAGGLLVTNMEAIFSPGEKVEEVQPMLEQSISVPESTKDTIVISKTVVVPPKKVEKKTETEIRKEEGYDW
jgi:hypothetical protein